MSKLLRDVSRDGWLMGKDGPTDAEIQSGSQQRIADALERLASGKAELETLKQLSDARISVGILQRQRDYQKFQIAAYKGHITRLKKAK